MLVVGLQQSLTKSKTFCEFTEFDLTCENEYLSRHCTKNEIFNFSKCDQIRRKLWICSHILKKSLMEKYIFCAVRAVRILPFCGSLLLSCYWTPLSAWFFKNVSELSILTYCFKTFLFLDMQLLNFIIESTAAQVS